MAAVSTILAVAAFTISAVSAAYQVIQAKKLKEKADAAAEARKGFEVTSEGTAEKLPIVYGRALIGGVRAWAKTGHNFTYPGTSNSNKSFLTGSASQSGYTQDFSTWDTIENFRGVSVARSQNLVPAMESGHLNKSLSGKKNEFLFFQQALCIGPIHAVHDITIDGSRYINDPTVGAFTTTEDDSTARIRAAMRVDCHYAGGVASNIIAANFSERADSIFKDVAYLSGVVRLDRDEPQFSGMVSIQALMEGRLVKTVTNGVLASTRTYSNNSALCLLDYLTDPLGKDIPLDEIDLASFEAGAIISARLARSSVPVGGKIFQPTDGSRDISARNLPLYECNLVVDTRKSVRENIEAILATMGDARLVWSGGVYKLNMQVPETNEDIVLAEVIDDTKLSLDQTIEINWPSGDDKLNHVKVRFSNEHENFKEDVVSWPPKYNSSYYKGVGGHKLATSVGSWDDSKTGGNLLNNHGVWDSTTTTHTSVHRFRVPKSKAGTYTLNFTADSSITIAVKDFQTNVSLYSGTHNNQNTVGSASLSLGSASVEKLYEISITATKSGNSSTRGAAAKLTNSGSVLWSTRDATYTAFDLVEQTNSIYTNMLAEDGIELEAEVFLSGCTDPYHATAKAEEMVRTSRTAAKVKFNYRISDRYLEPGDIIRLESEILNIGIEEDLYVRLDEVKVQVDRTCDLSGSRFDYSQLAFNVADDFYANPAPIFSTRITPPSDIVYSNAFNEAIQNSGRLTWGVSSEPSILQYIVYVHIPSSDANSTAYDASGAPIYTELCRSETNTVVLPPISASSAYFCVKVLTVGGLSLGVYTDRVTAVELSHNWLRRIELSASANAFIANAGGSVSPANSVITATVFNYDSPVYKWFIDGVEQVGQTSSSLTLASFNTTASKTVKVWVSEAGSLDTQVSSLPIFYLEAGADGANGINTATIQLYQRAASAPTKPASTLTYTFATRTLSGNLESWSTTVPAGTNPVYVTAAVASSDATADTIVSADWATPVVLVQNGANGDPGAPGLNSATITLYKRTTGTTPAGPTGDAVYTFATGALSTANLNGWTQTIPSGTAALWAITRSVSTSATTSTITSGQWSTAQIMALNSAIVYIYKRATSVPATPTVSATYNWSTGAITGLDGGWTVTIPSGTDPLYVSAATVLNSQVSIASNAWSTATILSQNGAAGATGSNSAIVTLYRRSATSPAVPTATLTYTFATGVLSGTLSGWTQSIPSGADPLYAILATATSTGATDTIATAEWSTPGILAQNGSEGAPGLNNATVILYRRDTVVPPAPAATLTYTFATGVLSGTLSGWTQSIPSGTDPIYSISALASATGATDSIATGEWTIPRVVAQNGADGADGLNSATVTLYKRATSAPAVPVSSLTYTFSTSLISGALDGWTQNIPTGVDPLYATLATATSTSGTDIILTAEWSTPRVVAQNGVDGLNSITVMLFQRTATDTAPAVPSGSLTYTFGTGTLTGTLGSWTRSVPASGGAYCWVTSAVASSNTASDTIASVDWTSPTVMSRDGTNGTNGVAAISAVLSKPAVTIRTDINGDNGDFSASGTTLYVYEGSTPLTYDGVGTAAGTWRVTVTGSLITPGAVTDSGAFATVANITAISSNNGKITFDVAGKRADGSTFTITSEQTFTKVLGAILDTTPPAAPTNLAVAWTVETLNDGYVQVKGLLTWTASASADIGSYELGIRETGAPAYVTFPASGTSFERIFKLNQAYDFSLVAVDKSGNRSTVPLTLLNQTSSRDTTAPAAPTPDAANTKSSLRSAFLRWTNVATSDLARVLIYEAVVNNGASAPTSASALLISVVNASPSQVGGYTRAGLDATKDYYYWFKSEDTSGNISAAFSTVLGPIASSKLANDDITADSINANKLASNTSLPASLLIGQTGFRLDVNPASIINDPDIAHGQSVVAIEPGRILVSGSTYLSDWRSGADETKINGGVVAANSILASSITVGARGLEISGLNFSITSNTQVSWTAGTITYISDSGTKQTVNIAAGSYTKANSAATGYLYWSKDSTTLTGLASTAGVDTTTTVLLATYAAGTPGLLVATYGRSFIDGDRITTDSITAAQLKAGSVVAGKIAAGTIDGTELSATLSLSVGTDDDAFFVSGVNPDWRIWAGSTNPESAPFRVSKAGKLVTTSLETRTSDNILHWSSEGGHTQEGLNQMLALSSSQLPVTTSKTGSVASRGLTTPSGTLTDSYILKLRLAGSSDLSQKVYVSLNGYHPNPSNFTAGFVVKLYRRYRQAVTDTFGAWSEIASQYLSKLTPDPLASPTDDITYGLYSYESGYWQFNIGDGTYDWVVSTNYSPVTRSGNDLFFSVTSTNLAEGFYEYAIGTGLDFSSTLVTSYRIETSDADSVPSILLGSTGSLNSVNFTHPLGFISKLVVQGLGTTINASFETCVLYTNTGAARTVRNFSGVCDATRTGSTPTTPGPGGISEDFRSGFDSYKQAGLWLISNGLEDHLIIAKLTNPTLPEGYSYKKLLSILFTPSNTPGVFLQHMGKVRLGDGLMWSSGNKGNYRSGNDLLTTDWQSTPIRGGELVVGPVVPLQAHTVTLRVRPYGGWMYIADANTYESYGHPTLPPPIVEYDHSISTHEVPLYSDNLFVIANGGTNASIKIAGFEFDV